MTTSKRSFTKSFIKAIYADHNSSRTVKDTLARLISEQSDHAFMLNIGAGDMLLHPNMKTTEITDGPGIDYVCSVTSLPMADCSVDLIVSQEVLEHVDDPFLAMREIYRVLKKGSQAYIQLPFIIGYHPCPQDYWRFTKEGIIALANKAGFLEIQSGTTVGPATGYYRISVEFFAILCSVVIHPLYRPAKAVFAILFFPIKWIDYFVTKHPESDRIAGGYFVTLTK